MFKSARLLCLMLVIIYNSAFAWNAQGHQLIAQIAWHHLTDDAKAAYVRYNKSLEKVYKSRSFVNAAPWMDGLRYMNELWLQPMHYIDIPFSQDGTKLIQPDKTNAVSAINIASAVIRNQRESAYNKGFSMRILLHVVGDLHQPMHAVNEFSARHTNGDAGGNLLFLGKNPVGKNLHSYWDNGGGMLKGSHKLSQKQLNTKAYQIESRWPCNLSAMHSDPAVWSDESHQLAITKAYTIRNGQKPDKHYQNMVKEVAEQRIALAGCRLAYLLNTLTSDTLAG